MRRPLIPLVLCAVALAACSSSSKKSAAPTTTVAPTTTTVPYTPKLEPRDCGYNPPLKVSVTCSWLDVPENRTKAGGRTIQLAVAVLHSKSATPKPDPVVYLHGGPGGDEVAGAGNGWDTDSRLADRDIVLYDQRGAGASQPNLNCPEVDDSILERFQSVAPFDKEYADRKAAVSACHARLTNDGFDLAQYNSEASAADLNDLRIALKLPKWNLLGVSYGTRLALTEMQSYPEGIRTVLLDSVYPTNVGGLQRTVDSATRAFTQLATGCSENTTCKQKYGDLNVLLQKAYDQLDAHPYKGTVDLGADNGGKIPLEINGPDALVGLFTALYDHNLIPQLPNIINQIAQGKYDLIPAIAQQSIPFATQFADGDAFSVDCADSGAVDKAGTNALIANPDKWSALVGESSMAYCDLWNVPPLPASYNEPVHSAIPTLVTAGKYDPVTPPADSEGAAQALDHATFVEIDGIGHGVIFSNRCGSQIYSSFLDAPSAPNTTCAPQQPAPAFS